MGFRGLKGVNYFKQHEIFEGVPGNFPPLYDVTRPRQFENMYCVAGRNPSNNKK